VSQEQQEITKYWKDTASPIHPIHYIAMPPLPRNFPYAVEGSRHYLMQRSFGA